MIGLCEHPASLCLDEFGNVLIFDRAGARVSQFSRTYFEKICDVALVNRAYCLLSAYQGVLAIISKSANELTLHRYQPKVDYIF